jgi:hypothetical protein
MKRFDAFDEHGGTRGKRASNVIIPLHSSNAQTRRGEGEENGGVETGIRCKKHGITEQKKTDENSAFHEGGGTKEKVQLTCYEHATSGSHWYLFCKKKKRKS